MRQLMLLLLVILALGAPTRADEILAPGATPTPDQDPVSQYGLAGLCLRPQVRTPDGNIWQHPSVEVRYIALRDDGTCAMESASKSCRYISQSYSGSTATTLISTLNTANLTNNSLVKRAINFGIDRAVLPAGAVAGTPGITTHPTPTP